MLTTHLNWLRSGLRLATVLILLAATSAADYRLATASARDTDPHALPSEPTCVRPTPWQTAPAMITSRFNAAAVAADGHVFVLGGRNYTYGSGAADVESAPIGADGTLGAWITTTALTSPDLGLAAAAANGYIYVLYAIAGWGGGTQEVLVERAHISAAGQLDSWEPQGWAPAHGLGFLSVVATGTHIYAIGGTNADSRPDISHDVQVAAIQLDHSLGPWLATSPLPIGRSGAGAVIVGTFIYVLGGDDVNNPGAGQSVERAEIQPNGSLDAWQELAPLQRAHSSGAALASDGYLYAIGGSNSSTVERAAIQADGALGPWEYVDLLRTGREAFGAASFNGHFYIMGGNNADYGWGNSAISTVEQVRASDLAVIGDNGLTINNGALFTNQTAVTLTVSGQPGIVEMQLSNDGGFAGAEWQECVSPLPWTLTQYGQSTIPRVVYIKFKDTQGRVSATYSDDIILDMTAPTGTAQLQPLAQSAGRPAFQADQPYRIHLPLVMSNVCAPGACPPNAMLRLSASDDASGVGSMQIGNDPAFSGRLWEPYGPGKPWYLPAGQTSVYVRFRDNAGNVSNTLTASIGP